MADVVAALAQPKLAADGLRPADGVDDMTHISDIDVNGINQNLRVRYCRDEIYTYTGTILVAVNPYKFLPIYETEAIERYRGAKMGEKKPHIFATAEAAYLNVQRSDKNQSCVISGESGAGKTETTKFILQYLCTVTSSVSKWVEQQILECNVILEAFGNAKTARNDNSSRFGKFIQVCFDSNCEIKGSIIQEYLLEQSRITDQAEGERNYHVFYQLLKGGDKEEYLLQDVKSYHYVNQSGTYTLTDVDDGKAFSDLRMAMTVLNIPDNMSEGIFRLVSAVLYIGQLTFTDLEESVGLTPDDKTVCAKVAKLLRMKPAQIETVVTTRQIVVRGQGTTIPFKHPEAIENRNAMAKALYSRTFTWLVDLINGTTNPGAFTEKFIGVLDIFGFENFQVNSFEQLCINFTNEKLHKFFNHYVFALEQEEYLREGINFSHIKFTDNTLCLELIEKPPKCVLRLLDEECRFPKGSDESFLEKQHQALGGHPHYVKPHKSRMSEEFGVLHFAGVVQYRIHGFLDKNKDVMQDQLFEFMRQSSDEFVRDVTKFQNMLAMDRKVVMGKRLRRTKSIVPGSGSNPESLRTNKAKPTVGDTFRRQLAALVEVLEDTTPWYVRCIKPNAMKKPGKYEDDLCTTQLQYSGMLDIVRIRKEGFPVHVPAESFVDKYHSMATIMGKRLSTDPKEAVREIMTFIKAPETEWQVGKTKVFLRNSVFEPLEAALRQILQERVVKIQALFRGYRARKEYKATLVAIVRIQAAVRAAAQRWKYLRQKRAAIRLQAAVRGWRDREVVKEMKREIEKEKKRKKKEAAEKKKRAAQEQGETMMEESFLQAQKELFAMAKFAEAKAEQASSRPSGDVDSMFTFLADDKNPQAPGKDAAMLAKVNTEIDAIFADDKPEAPGKRTMRRRKRVQKKQEAELQAEEAAAAEKEEAAPDPMQYSMDKFASNYFNTHPWSEYSLLRPGKNTLKRSKKDGSLSWQDMTRYTSSPTIPTSLVHLHNPEDVDLAVIMWKDINKQLSGALKPEVVMQSTQSIVAYCLERVALRDEVFCQVMRQANNCPDPEVQRRAWLFMMVLVVSYPPSKRLYPYMQAFMRMASNDSNVSALAKWTLDALKRTKLNGPRRHAPSTLEIETIKSSRPHLIRFFFLDGNVKAIQVHPCHTTEDTIKSLAEKIGLLDTLGWALFEVTPDFEHYLRGQTYIGDVLAEWEAAQRTSVQMSKYQTMARRGSSFNAAMGGGDSRFVFRQRLFLNPRALPTDPVEHGLVYAQAVQSVTALDEFPTTEQTARTLAGLQAQVLFGEPAADKKSRYENLGTFLPLRIRAGVQDDNVWVDRLYEAHKEFGAGKTDVEAKVMYLTCVKQFQLYGGTFFPVEYKGHWSYPTRLILSIHNVGFKFVNPRSKDVMAEYEWRSLQNVEVNSWDDTITLNMIKQAAEDSAHFTFVTPRKEDIAGLIASYSPSHRNWKQVGVAPVRAHKSSENEKARLLNDVRLARRALGEAGILMKPQEHSKGFVATTLRLRRSSKSKLETDKSDTAGQEFAKAFPDKYWSYHKSRVSQPLSQMSSEETAEVALRLFASLLVHAGLAGAGGVESEDDPEHVNLIQVAIQKCLEKEDVCNEFYLQLIKQTTDNPFPNSKENARNWQMFALILGVVVPRNPKIRNYIVSHLRLCAADSETEEGAFAQFCESCLQRTTLNKNRKYPPSQREILCVKERRPIFSRFHFMGGEFRTFTFDSAATTNEVVGIIMEKIGLSLKTTGFSLFEVFGPLKRNMLAWEKVADAMFKWEKYAKSCNSDQQLQLTFKKRLFLAPFGIPSNQVEFDLVFHQALDDIKYDRFPVSNQDAAYLTALRAQVELGDLDQSQPVGDTYNVVVDSYLPKHLRSMVQPEDIAAHHAKLKGLSKLECNTRHLKFVQAWPLYGSTIFEVLQNYTPTLPKNLWLAVNEKGVHIMRRRNKEPLITYEYRNIVNYSPSLRNLMIVTESLTRGTKYVFNTTQASQIAHLIKDYTHIIIQRRAQAKAQQAKAK